MEKYLTIKEVCQVTGLSKRTLHYYDQIDLFKPDRVLDNKYRQYARASLDKLKQILFYRALDFPLKEIKMIMESENFDAFKALRHQRSLLEMKRQQMDDLIDLIDQTMKGERAMDFKAFDASAIRAHEAKFRQETEDLYGDSEAYKLANKKFSQYTDEDLESIQDQYEAILKGLANLLGHPPESQPVQDLVKAWQDHITTYYYPCNKDILLGLSHMYQSDDQFRSSMDAYGTGVTDLLVAGIQCYVDHK